VCLLGLCTLSAQKAFLDVSAARTKCQQASRPVCKWWSGRCACSAGLRALLHWCIHYYILHA
jgi:hypothetical protein